MLVSRAIVWPTRPSLSIEVSRLLPSRLIQRSGEPRYSSPHWTVSKLQHVYNSSGKPHQGCLSCLHADVKQRVLSAGSSFSVGREKTVEKDREVTEQWC
jgi:hypothetical protein